MSRSIDHNDLYRLPWNYADNGISWLEPTSVCNIRCEGCYRDSIQGRHKSVEEIQLELEVFKKMRKSDCMSITGGDPLCHPAILDVVRMSRQMGWKPIINTNGAALTPEFTRKLKQAGAFGFTFHIDTSQHRPKEKVETEAELNDVRLRYAKMLDDVGGIACSFNSTVSDKTIEETANLVRWAQQHPDIVHTMVFILFRSPDLVFTVHDAYAYARKIEIDSTYKDSEWGGERVLYAQDVVEKLRGADPLYEPSAFLNGTADPSSLKWLLATRVVFNGKVMGYCSPRFQELVQVIHHTFKGTYLSYVGPSFGRTARLGSFLFGLVDRKMRRIFLRILGAMLKNPLNLFRRAYFQSLMVIQPMTIFPDGRQDMCDACPDITVYQGKLVWSCRLAELENFGCFVTSVPSVKGKTEKEAEGVA